MKCLLSKTTVKAYPGQSWRFCSIESLAANMPGLVIWIFSKHCSHTISPAKSCTFSLASHKVHGRGNFTTLAELTNFVDIRSNLVLYILIFNKFQYLIPNLSTKICTLLYDPCVQIIFYNFHVLRSKIAFIFVQHHVQNNNHINQVLSMKKSIYSVQDFKTRKSKLSQFFLILSID